MSNNFLWGKSTNIWRFMISLISNCIICIWAGYWVSIASRTFSTFSNWSVFTLSKWGIKRPGSLSVVITFICVCWRGTIWASSYWRPWFKFLILKRFLRHNEWGIKRPGSLSVVITFICVCWWGTIWASGNWRPLKSHCLSWSK